MSLRCRVPPLRSKYQPLPFRDRALRSVADLLPSVDKRLSSAGNPPTSVANPLSSAANPLASMDDLLTSLTHPLTSVASSLSSINDLLASVTHPLTLVIRSLSLNRRAGITKTPRKRFSTRFGLICGMLSSKGSVVSCRLLGVRRPVAALACRFRRRGTYRPQNIDPHGWQKRRQVGALQGAARSKKGLDLLKSRRELW